MNKYISRSKKRLAKLHEAAEKGRMFLDNELLYSSEIKKYEKQGFSVSYSPSIVKDLYKSKIEWSYAFSKVPYPVIYYIAGIVSIYPSNDIKTLAQELFVKTAYVRNMNKPERQ